MKRKFDIPKRMLVFIEKAFKLNKEELDEVKKHMEINFETLNDTIFNLDKTNFNENQKCFVCYIIGYNNAVIENTEYNRMAAVDLLMQMEQNMLARTGKSSVSGG